jgi:hypothetical protein
MSCLRFNPVCVPGLCIAGKAVKCSAIRAACFSTPSNSQPGLDGTQPPLC